MVHNTASQLPEMRLNILWALKIFSDVFLPFGRVLLLFQVCWDSLFLVHCQVSVPASYSFPCCHACVLALTFLALGFCLPMGAASCKRMLPQNWIWMQVIFQYFCSMPAVRVWLREWVKEQEWNCCKALVVPLPSVGRELSTNITFPAKWQMRPCPGLTLVVKPDLFGLTSSLLAVAI